MKLSILTEGLPARIQGNPDVTISDIVFDSRQVKPGALFVVFQGARQDGRQFIPNAIQSGAAAILSQTDLPELGVPVIKVPDTQDALARISIRFWNNPSHRLRMIGITGTNGKTTTSYLVESIFTHAQWASGVMGTINYRFGLQETPAPNTTPFSSEIQRFLSRILDQGAKACIMEVSSHALALGRVNGIEYDTAVFTNLTQDHLDFHETMEHYAESKAKLFAMIDPQSSKPYPRHVVINGQDPYSDMMAKSSRVPVLRYGLSNQFDIGVESLECDPSGSRFRLCTPAGQKVITLPLVGEYNVLNALAAAGVGIAQGIALETIVHGLENAGRVPGRMERFASDKGYFVVVDYAHTDDALRKVLGALRALGPKKLITVFGCGGDRDRAKRPLMGEAAAQLSDYVIVTSDNPRSEDPSRITLDIEVGVRRVRADHYEILLDREAAISRAIQMAAPGDIVLLAGKGHETYQILSDKTIPFDDREIAQRMIHAS